jgi:hypothetical protein
MKMPLKSVIDVLNRDANELDRYASKLKAVSPEIFLGRELDAELIDQRVASIREQVKSLEQYE